MLQQRDPECGSSLLIGLQRRPNPIIAFISLSYMCTASSAASFSSSLPVSPPLFSFALICFRPLFILFLTCRLQSLHISPSRLSFISREFILLYSHLFSFTSSLDLCLSPAAFNFKLLLSHIFVPILLLHLLSFFLCNSTSLTCSWSFAVLRFLFCLLQTNKGSSSLKADGCRHRHSSLLTVIGVKSLAQGQGGRMEARISSSLLSDRSVQNNTATGAADSSEGGVIAASTSTERWVELQ